MSKQEHNGLIRLAIDSFGFLVKWGSHLDFQEFATAIRRYSQHPRSLAIAEAVFKAEGFISRGWKGLSASWREA